MATRPATPAALVRSARVVFQPDRSVNACSGLSLSETLIMSRCITSESESVHCETQFQKLFALIRAQKEAVTISGNESDCSTLEGTTAYGFSTLTRCNESSSRAADVAPMADSVEEAPGACLLVQCMVALQQLNLEEYSNSESAKKCPSGLQNSPCLEILVPAQQLSGSSTGWSGSAAVAAKSNLQQYGALMSDMIQVTIKCDKQIFVFDWISRNAQCSDLLSMLEVRMAIKIPGNAQLMENGRFIGISKSIDEAGLIESCTLEVEFGISGGMRCFRCLRPNVESESEHQNSGMRAQEGEK